MDLHVPNYPQVILDIFGRLLSPLSHLPFGQHCLVTLTPNDCHSSLCLEFHPLLSLVTDISLSKVSLSGIQFSNKTLWRVPFNTCKKPSTPISSKLCSLNVMKVPFLTKLFSQGFIARYLPILIDFSDNLETNKNLPKSKFISNPIQRPPYHYPKESVFFPLTLFGIV